MSRNSHRGMAILEVVAACGLLMAMMAVAAGIYALAYRGQQGAQRHSWALTEAANCLERMSAWDWDNLTPKQAAAETLSHSAQDVLGPSGTLTARVEEVGTEPVARRIVVEVHWSNEGRPAPVVRLVTWRYRVQPPTTAGAAP